MTLLADNLGRRERDTVSNRISDEKESERGSCKQDGPRASRRKEKSNGRNEGLTQQGGIQGLERIDRRARSI